MISMRPALRVEALGIVQATDNAAMELYVAYRHYEVDQLDLTDVTGAAVGAGRFEDIDVVLTGARIKF